MRQLADALESVQRPRILVLGDVILDRYTWGDTNRVSPEAPVLVLQADQYEVRLGGAASVAALLKALGTEVELAGIIGSDTEGQLVRKLVDEAGIEREAVLCDPGRPTTSKERFIGRAAHRHPHQILRVDCEARTPLERELENQLMRHMRRCVTDYDMILVSDYAKGVCTPGLLQSLIRTARCAGVPVVVDPARTTDYGRYRGGTILTPNRVEAELAGGCPIQTPDDARTTGRMLVRRHDIAAALIKLDRDGIVLALPGTDGRHFPTRPRAVYDVTGAGDTVLAMTGLCLSAGVSLEETAELANLAAGLQVERLGVVPISRDEIRQELRRPQLRMEAKLVSLDRMTELAEEYRRAGRRIVLTNGCFDLLHGGHAACLAEAAQLADVLVVAVNSDASVRRLKGPDRPVIREQDRALLLAALGCVDHVLIFDDSTPHALLERIRPDILVKGGAYTVEEVVGHEVVESYGGRVRVTKQLPGLSTTGILSVLQSARSRSTPGNVPI